MEKKRKIGVTLPQALWGTLGCMCLIGVITAGAWWHLGTAAMCAMLFFANAEETREETNE